MNSTHIEFSFAAEVWLLEGENFQPCSELGAICRLIDAPEFTRSLEELHPRDDPMVTISTSDPTCFLRIDLTADPTDQMDVVAIQVRCKADLADSVNECLRQIRSRSEVKTAILHGNLGLSIADPLRGSRL
jgi:hypothetical protein